MTVSSKKGKVKRGFISIFMDLVIPFAKGTSSHEDIVEVLNDGFLKVFTEVHRFEKRQDSLEGSLKAWIRRVLVNTSIDRLRKANQKKN